MSDGLNIVITGTSSGFGNLTAKTLAKDGHHVFASMRGLTSKNFGAAQELRQWAQSQEVTLEVIELDVTDQTSVDRGISSILNKVGHIDVVVNNAGTANVFGKLIVPADGDVLAGYGEMATKPQEMFAGMAEMLTGPEAPNPQAVADAIKELIGAPAGQRPLRTVVGPLTVDGVEELNDAYDQAKQTMLQALGV